MLSSSHISERDQNRFLDLTDQVIAESNAEVTRTQQNEKMVQRNALKHLGYLYDVNQKKIAERAVDLTNTDQVISESSQTKYMFAMDSKQDAAEKTIESHLGLNLTGKIHPLSITASISGNVASQQVEKAARSSFFCVAACVRVDRCRARALLPCNAARDSSSLAVITSVTIYTGYRVVLEVRCSHLEKGEESQKAFNANAKILEGLVTPGFELKKESKTLSKGTITQINIREITACGSYRVPSVVISEEATRDMQAIQGILDTIRKDFHDTYHKIGDRNYHIDPAHDLIPLQLYKSEYLNSLPSTSSRPLISIEEGPSTSEPLIRDQKTYFPNLAAEIRSKLSENFRNFLSRELELNSREISLERMLSSIERVFSSLIAYAPSKQEGSYALILGEDGSGKSSLVAYLMGGNMTERVLMYPGQKAGKSVIDYSNESSGSTHLPEINHTSFLPGVKIHDHYIESSILSRKVDPEDDICQGVATRLAIEYYQPSKIIIVLNPHHFGENGSRIIELVSRLRRILYNPTSKDAKPNILFVMNDKSWETHDWEPAKRMILDCIASLKEKQDKLKNTEYSHVSFWGFFFKGTLREEFIDPKDRAFKIQEIENEIEILQLLHDRSVLANFFNDSTRSIITRWCQNSSQELTSREFDTKNLALNSYSQFMLSLTLVASYFNNLLNDLSSLNNFIDDTQSIIKSIDTITQLFEKSDLKGVCEHGPERILGEAVSQVIKQLAIDLEEKESVLAKNQTEITEKNNEIERLKVDETPLETESLTSKTYIFSRGFLQLPPFGKNYEFEYNRPYEILRCEFVKGRGKFSCDERRFTTSKKASYTPKWYGYAEDTKAHIRIWIPSKDHLDIKLKIEKLSAELVKLEESNKRLTESITQLNLTIQNTKAREIAKLKESKEQLLQKQENKKAEQEILLKKLSEYEGFCKMTATIASHTYHNQTKSEWVKEVFAQFIKNFATDSVSAAQDQTFSSIRRTSETNSYGLISSSPIFEPGNSLFEAVAYDYYWYARDLQQDEVANLRAKVITEIRQNFKLRKLIEDNLSKHDESLDVWDSENERFEKTLYGNLDEYLDLMARNRTCATPIEIWALSKVLKCRIFVISNGNKANFCFNMNGSQNLKPIFLEHVGQQYQVLSPKEGVDAWEIASNFPETMYVYRTHTCAIQ